ncbi:hypothetical protein QBC35DRAFT_517081 [Podospora australis]|uniref:Ipa protein n=1 Tax=Podospora australis TaxID=1536484 RepID=A0AAN6WPL6_9PEZI|nr:hypothetical protein QBC35DRAFT_517081 [Podospora australis]
MAVDRRPFNSRNGVAHVIAPEWNLRHITKPDSDFPLDMLHFRATNPLTRQYLDGFGGRLDDHQYIRKQMYTCGLRFANANRHGSYILFSTDAEYGREVKASSIRAEELESLDRAIRAGNYASASTGQLILQRQIYLLRLLIMMVDDILWLGSTTRAKSVPKPTKLGTEVVHAISKLTVKQRRLKQPFPGLVDSVHDQKAALEERLSLITTEPTALHDVVGQFHFTQPELVADEHGRGLPVTYTDKYISGTVFEALHNSVQAAAVWGYLGRLLELLGARFEDNVYKPILLQEISNVCHFEYARTQQLFKRQLQTGDCAAAKWFERVSNDYDKSGNAHVTIKGNPEEPTVQDPELLYILRLCQLETTPAKAVDWLKKLGDLQTEMFDEEDHNWEFLFDLAIITSFIRDLSPTISMPALSRKKGRMFVSRSEGLAAELNKPTDLVDLSDFASPLGNLLEPGMAESALRKLNGFIVERTGTKLGFLYQDLISDCLPGGPRKPIQAAQGEIIPHAPSPIEPATPPAKPLRVSRSTLDVFMGLFQRSEARGSLDWTSFEAAMTELKFSVIPKFGPVYTFSPPDDPAVKRSVTVHRPHKSELAGYPLLFLANRLKRVYGWGETTFVLEK